MKIKSVNDVMIFCLEDMLFYDFLNELDELLDQAIFNNDCFYPKAFFDFNCRKLSQNECVDLLCLLNKKEKILFCGMTLNKKDEYILINNDLIRNGEEVYVKQKTVFTNKVNKGSYIYCAYDVYFIDEIKGTVVLLNEHVKIFANKVNQASFMMNHKVLYNVTSFSHVHIYYNGEELICAKEENDYESNHCVNFR